MKAVAEFRIPEHLASTLLPPSTGRTVGGFIRVVRVTVGEPLYQMIGAEDQSRRKGGAGGLFTFWDIRRTYSPQELAEAQLLHMRLTSGFQPHGEECGTQYEDSKACQFCGAGRVQASPLSLDLRRLQPERDIETETLPRNKDIARSIADEIVIGRRLADLLRRVSATGYELQPVVKCNSTQAIADWYQFGVTGGPVEAIPPTTYGIDPFDLDEAGRYRCPRGHVAGLNLLSDITIDRSTWHGEDLVVTRQLVGWREGVLVSTPSILVSGSVYRHFAEARIKGARFEVANVA